MKRKLTILCVACDFKGNEFLKAAYDLGHRVFLVTSQVNENEPWVRECLEDIFFMPQSDGRKWDINTLIEGTAYIFSKYKVDKIIALDDYDVRKVAMLREEFRSPGMGQTTARHFYDKLAMRIQARDHDIRIPDFSPLFNDDDINNFLSRNEPPYVVKPRSDAGALGIRKLYSPEEYWKWNEENKEIRHTYLIESFKPGHVYHVDSLYINYNPIFTRSSRYMQPPFDIAHGGGIFRSQTLPIESDDEKKLAKLNRKLLKAFGLNFGAAHSEFIKNNEDGNFYFLETSARVGGAHLADMVEAATGVNLWAEWARIEVAMLMDEKYEAPKSKELNAGILATLSRFEHPDYSGLQHPSVVWTMNKSWHVGLIVNDESEEKVTEYLDSLSKKIHEDYHAVVPLKE